MNNRNPIAIKKRQDRESERRLGRLQKRYTIQATNREEQVATDSMEWGAFPGVSGERLNGIQEVRGSIPLISTRKRHLQKQVPFYEYQFHIPVAVFLGGLRKAVNNKLPL